MRIRCQGHCLTFDIGHSSYDNFKHLLKTTGQIVTKFNIELPFGLRENREDVKLDQR